MLSPNINSFKIFIKILMCAFVVGSASPWQGVGVWGLMQGVEDKNQSAFLYGEEACSLWGFPGVSIRSSPIQPVHQ